MSEYEISRQETEESGRELYALKLDRKLEILEASLTIHDRTCQVCALWLLPEGVEDPRRCKEGQDIYSKIKELELELEGI